jgi:uncharacterized membrane protein
MNGSEALRLGCLTKHGKPEGLLCSETLMENQPMNTSTQIFIHVLGLMLMLYSLYDAMFLTHGADPETFVMGVAGIFIFWWPVVVEEVMK